MFEVYGSKMDGGALRKETRGEGGFWITQGP